MVDKVLELLPLYLALSTQTEGARRLLVMVRAFPFFPQAVLMAGLFR